MRIAYIAPYQGPGLLAKRPALHNRSLAGRAKIELIARLLRQSSHEVEVISQGEVDRYECRFYPSFCETQRFHQDIPVYYSSALPIRFLSGIWEGRCAQELLNIRHNRRPFDLVIIYNTKRAQLGCASYAIRRLQLPVILEYEDDSFVSVTGETMNGFRSRLHSAACNSVLRGVAGCIAVSPYLLAQCPPGVPKLLLRGVVDDDIASRAMESSDSKKNWVLFSGTHTRSKGIEQLIMAWKTAALRDWELHITGCGEQTETLQQMAKGDPTIVFHGFVGRGELVRLLCSVRICINPHDLSRTPGNVFAFKIIEYLAAGAHVITTPMGELEKEIEAGITYLPNNSPEMIAATLKRVIQTETWRNSAAQCVVETCGTTAVSKALDQLTRQVVGRRDDC